MMRAQHWLVYFIVGYIKSNDYYLTIIDNWPNRKTRLKPICMTTVMCAYIQSVHTTRTVHIWKPHTIHVMLNFWFSYDGSIAHVIWKCGEITVERFYPRVDKTVLNFLFNILYSKFFIQFKSDTRSMQLVKIENWFFVMRVLTGNIWMLPQYMLCWIYC